MHQRCHGDGYVGGLVGWMREGSTLTASYATGDVNGGDGDDNNVGGLVGSMWSGTLTASYASGTVNGSGRVGGLVGQQEGGALMASYARAQPMAGLGRLMLWGV